MTSVSTPRRSSKDHSDETPMALAHERSRTPWAIACVLAVALVVVGGLWWADARTTGDGGTDAAATNGTTTCQVPSRTSRPEGDNLVVIERFECENVMSDPRVSGTYRSQITSVYEPADSTTARYSSEDATVTNDAGVWRGTERGVSYYDASSGEAYNYGYTIFIGEGAYDGLEFHSLVSGTNADLVLAGWVVPANTDE